MPDGSTALDLDLKQPDRTSAAQAVLALTQWTFDEALAEIEAQAGQQFAPGWCGSLCRCCAVRASGRCRRHHPQNSRRMCRFPGYNWKTNVLDGPLSILATAPWHGSAP
ncbi:hypothetical protein GCM10010840_36050 [Deinococcus aerolatus]|uniref:Uncharacterized protein n=1 Tax=Deinococcus aerolatus TaxID=522487 RepID=A0ABQ2GHG4_9DEIO|nr:hypothetical protein GCM10010840_36050 [Deinococcus aerolatus]